MHPDRDFSQLTTARLLLRRSIPEDAETIAAYRSDPDVNRYQGWEQTDAASVRESIEVMADHAPGEPGGWVQFSVVDRDTGRLVGDVGLSPADGEPDVIRIGYTVAPEFQGQGFATEAMEALAAYAVDVLEAGIVRAYASAENIASTRVAEKIGMKLMERFTGRDGDEVWHGVRYELRREDR